MTIERHAIVGLDLRTLTATVHEVEGEAVLVLDDGYTVIELVCGLGGPCAQAVLGAQRLQFAAQLLSHEILQQASRAAVRNGGHGRAA